MSERFLSFDQFWPITSRNMPDPRPEWSISLAHGLPPLCWRLGSYPARGG
jgi:hypothetical protein